MPAVLTSTFAMDSIVALKEACELEDLDAFTFHFDNLLDWYRDERVKMSLKDRCLASRIITVLMQVQCRLHQEVAFGEMMLLAGM